MPRHPISVGSIILVKRQLWLRNLNNVTSWELVGPVDQIITGGLPPKLMMHWRNDSLPLIAP